MLDIDEYRSALDKKPRPRDLTAAEWKRQQWKRLFARCDWWLDHQPAARHLQDERLASEVVSSLCHFAGERYALWAFVVMPSHFHCVFEPDIDWIAELGKSADERTPRERIMHSVKLHSARKCNGLLGKSGAFWQDESYDHCIEDTDELERVIAYIENNPIVAGLAKSPDAWLYSSARYRKDRNILGGQPIIGKSAI